MAKKSTAAPSEITAATKTKVSKKAQAATATDPPAEKPVTKRTKVSSLDDVIDLLKENKVDKAITALEKLKKSTFVKKERKPRAPTPFNLFVSQKMAELKNSGMSTNERMKECARLWKEQQQKK